MQHRHKHELKGCPACGRLFECKAGDVANCQCSLVVLTEEERKLLSETFSDCICSNCLEKIKMQLKSQS